MRGRLRSSCLNRAPYAFHNSRTTTLEAKFCDHLLDALLIGPEAAIGADPKSELDQLCVGILGDRLALVDQWSATAKREWRG